MRKSLAALAALLALSATAQAQTKIRLAHTTSDAYLAAFVAKDLGLFEKRGLDVQMQVIAINSTMPAALHSESVEIAGTTTPVFLQAVDSGIDLVALSAGNVAEKTNTQFGAVLRPDITYAKPADFIGKKIGAPGLGANTHVLFRNWLLANGVDYKKVNFVEVSFPQMNDVLKGGTVDGVIASDPILTRIISAGTGKNVAAFMDALTVEIPIIVYSATRKWATAHPKEAKAFQEAIVEAVATITKDPEVARTSLGAHVKLPPEVLKVARIPRYHAEVTAESLKSWADIMAKQDMLQTKLDIAKLIVK